MPIDARIPLMGHKPDPNSFTNALAAGMKMRELQNASDRLAQKDEAAQMEANALAEYGRSPRDQAALDRVWAKAPGKAMGIEKGRNEAANNAAQAKLHQLTWAKANHGLLVEATGAMAANPTRDNVTMILDSIEAESQGAADMSRPRQQMASGPDEAIPGYIQGWAANATKLAEMARAEEKAAAPKRNSFTGEWEYPPAKPGSTTGDPQAGPEPVPTTVAPPGPPAERRPVMVPGETSGSSTDEIRAEIARLKQGGAPSPQFFGKSKNPLESLEMLLVAQTDLENAQGGAQAPPADVSVPPALPVDSQPAPVDTPPPPLLEGGPPRSPAEAAWQSAQRQDARAVESQRLAGERQEKGFAHAEKMAEDARVAKAVAAEAKRSQPTAQTAAKGREKLQTLDIIDAQLDKVEAAFMGEKGPDGSRSGGIENSFSAGYGVGGYLPTEGGRSFDATIDGLRPFLRQISRTPGEGAMSDYETKQAEALLPSRNDHESVTKQKIQQLRDISKQSRLSLTAPVQATPQGDRPSPTPVKVAPVEDLDAMPMPGKYAGKFLTTPEGIRYRSDGSKWIRQ